MGQHRMFSKDVVSSDLFLDQPSSARLLYFNLGMEADDDGFVSKPKALTRMYGGSIGDLNVLANSGFIIPFNSGVIVIADWKVNNMIRKDRHKATRYTSELQQLQLTGDRYKLMAKNRVNTDVQPTVNQMTTNGQPDDNQTTAQGKLSKDKLSKDIVAAYDDDYREPQEKNLSVAVNDSLKTNQDEKRSPSFHDVTQFWQKQGFGALAPLTADKLRGWWQDFQDIGSSPNEAAGILIKGMETAIDSGKTNFGYLNGILRNWEQKHLTNVAAVEAHEQQRKAVKSYPRRGYNNPNDQRNEVYHDSDWDEVDARIAARKAAETNQQANGDDEHEQR